MRFRLSISINTSTLFDGNRKLLVLPTAFTNMTFDSKIRVALLVVSVALSAVAFLASAHGIYFSPLDEIGGVPH